MNDQDDLFEIFEGCFDPDTVHICEEQLKEQQESRSFIENLLTIISYSDEPGLLMLMCTHLRNIVVERYNSPTNPLTPGQKVLIRSELQVLFYIASGHLPALRLIQEVTLCVIRSDFPWKSLGEALDLDFRTQRTAGLYLMMLVIKEYGSGGFSQEQMVATVELVEVYLQRLTDLFPKLLRNLNHPSHRGTLYLLMEIFDSIVQEGIPSYLRNFGHL